MSDPSYEINALQIDVGDVARLLRKTSPNARTHWAAKANATALLRRRTFAAASALPAELRQQWASAHVQLTLRVATRRRRDADNVIASCKAVFDGLTDAGVILDDDRLTHHPVLFEVVPKDAVGLTVEVWP